MVLSRTRNLACKPAAAVTQPASSERLLQGRFHVVVTPPSRMALALPTAANMPLDRVRIQRPTGMPLPGHSFLPEIDVPAMTVAHVPGAMCLPGGVMLAAPDVVLEESFSAPWEREHHHHLERAGAGYTLKKDWPDPVFLPGGYICLDYQHYLHYGHFLVDVLSRCWAYDFLDGYLGVRNLRVLVAAGSAPFADGLLDLYGIPPDRIVRLDRPVTVERLFVPSKSFQIQEYTSPPATATWRRISNAARGEGGPSRIYVSRSRVGTRYLLNEPEVEALLASKGFSIVHPQELTAPQQVALFANAELVVASSGSNIFNLAFQRRLRAALVLVSPALVHHTDVFMRADRPSELGYFVGERAADHPGFNPADVHAVWRVDMERLAQCLDAWLRGR